MKKILKITGITLASLMGIAVAANFISGSVSSKEGNSSTERKSVEKSSDGYTIKLEAKDHDGTEKEITFYVSDSVMRVKNLNENSLLEICNRAISWANFPAKNPLTYKIGTFGNISIDSDGDLYIGIDGEAQNSFGVPGSIFTCVVFKDNLEVDPDKISGF
jgi:hypothetical protein